MIYFEKDVTVPIMCQQLWQLFCFVLFYFFFLDFLKLVQGCDQYSGTKLLMPCQHLCSWASSSSVPLSISEAEFMADCPLSVTSGTVWLIWPVVLMCSRMRNAYCLPLARLSESARENVQENRDIHPSLPITVFFPLAPFSSALPHFRAELQGRHGGRTQVEALLQPGPLAE